MRTPGSTARGVGCGSIAGRARRRCAADAPGLRAHSSPAVFKSWPSNSRPRGQMPRLASFPMWPSSPTSARRASHAWQMLGALEGYARIVAARGDEGGKGKRRLRNWCELTDEVERGVQVLHIGRGREKNRRNLRPVFPRRRAGPFDNRDGGKRMRDQHRFARRRSHGVIHPAQPILRIGPFPIGLEDPAGVGKQSKPQGLPMAGCRIVSPGKNKEVEA